MSDALIQTVLQQREARPVSGEHLEVLGKKAAADWGMGKVASLHAAVVDVVRGEQLSPEQVHRVVEFCNSAAYLQEFRKEGSQHKVVHFDCGPADPAQVIQDLNDGGGGSRFDRGTLDYKMPPEQAHKVASFRSPVTIDFDKTASAKEDVPGADLPKLTKVPSLPKLAHPQARYEDDLWRMFAVEGSSMPMAEPLQPLRDVSEKIAGARDQLASEVDGLEVDLRLALDSLYGQVKQASLEGTSLGDVVTAWSSVTTDPVYVKVAFSQLYPRLRAEHVVMSLEDLGSSLSKVASAAKVVNPAHPLVTSYADFVNTFNKLSSARSLLNDLTEGSEYALNTLKTAARGGLIGAAQKGIGAVSSGIDRAAPTVAHALVGAKDAKKLAPTIAKGLKGTALVGGVLTANAAMQNVTDRPGVRGVVGAAKSVVPGTMEYQERRYRNMMGQ